MRIVALVDYTTAEGQVRSLSFRITDVSEDF